MHPPRGDTVAQFRICVQKFRPEHRRGSDNPVSCAAGLGALPAVFTLELRAMPPILHFAFFNVVDVDSPKVCLDRFSVLGEPLQRSSAAPATSGAAPSLSFSSLTCLMVDSTASQMGSTVIAEPANGQLE
jgi:hypothetical protein